MIIKVFISGKDSKSFSGLSIKSFPTEIELNQLEDCVVQRLELVEIN